MLAGGAGNSAGTPAWLMLGAVSLYVTGELSGVHIDSL